MINCEGVGSRLDDASWPTEHDRLHGRSLTPISIAETSPHLGAIVGHPVDPDRSKRTALGESDASHETTDQNSEDFDVYSNLSRLTHQILKARRKDEPYVEFLA